MKPQEQPAITLECKKIILLPCLKATILATGVQILTITVVIAFANFDLLHPIKHLIGFHWLKHVPLLGVLAFCGLVLSKRILTPSKYYPNRFKWFLGNGSSKVVLLFLEMLFGFLTAWSFLSCLPGNRWFFAKQNELTVINSHNIFLLFCGMCAGCYYFVRHLLGKDIQLHFEYIPKPIYIRLRESLLMSLTTSAKNAVLPTIFIAVLYWICGGMLNRRVASLFGVSIDSRSDNIFSIFTNIKMLCFAWIIVVEIFTIMSLMEQAFSIFLTVQISFPITGNLLDVKHITLVKALSMNDMPVIQKIAALEFYSIAKSKYIDKRKEIFALSQPGSHPYNWKQLSGECLSIINAYIAELKGSFKYFPGSRQTTPTLSLPSSTEMAQHILIRQHNEKHNIRRLRTAPLDIYSIEEKNCQPSSTVARINANFNRTTEEITQRIVSTIQSLPGFFYLFGEPEGAQLSYLLKETDLLIWIVQGIGDVCAASINEDSFGVVQMNLPEIMRTLLKFKAELDRLSSINFGSKKLDPNWLPLRNALKRCLHKISNAFAEFLPEIIEDPNDLPYLRTFLYQYPKC